MDELDIGSITLYVINDGILDNSFLCTLVCLSFIYSSIYKEKAIMEQFRYRAQNEVVGD